MKLLLVYLLLINALGFVVMLADKYRAQNKLRRTPEMMLFSIAILGGSLGIWGGMYAVRHKTKHRLFTIGIPIIVAMQICLIIVITKG